MEAPSLQQIYSFVVYDPLTAEPPQTPEQHRLNAIAPALWNAGRTREAISCLRLLDRRNGLGPNDYAIRGFWELNRGRLSEARLDFVAALEREPDHEWARLGYGHALFLAEDYERAASEFQGLIDFVQSAGNLGVVRVQ